MPRFGDPSIRSALLLLLASLALPATVRAQATSPPSGDKPWYERMTFAGDLRLRYESFYQADLEDRHRGRFRLRLGIRGPITDQLDFGVRLASGGDDDIVSTNQTMEAFLTRKPITIDQAYLTWRPAGSVTIGGGRYGFPVLRTQLVWDDDVNWEGAYQQVTLPGRVTARIIAAQSWIDESSGRRDAALFAEQARLTIPAGRHRVELTLASYAFRNVDAIARAIASGEVNGQHTNRLRTDGGGRVLGYASGYNLVDVIGVATLATGREQYPVTVLVEWLSNVDAATDQDTGVWIDAKYGRAASPGTYSVGYVFARAEREATLSAFNFSDLPGTNYRAHVVSASYQAARRVTVDFTGLFSKRIDVAPGEATHLLKRYQMDVRVAF